MNRVDDIAKKVEDNVVALERAFSESPEAQNPDLSHHAWEDWVTLGLFWIMVGSVFLQFFTRYALNNSLAWTEEIATNTLVVVVFFGASMCTRTTRHIHVDVLYHYLPSVVSRYLSMGVDIIRLTFFAYATSLMWRYFDIVADDRMISIDMPRSWFYYLVLIAFLLMTVRSFQVLVQNYRRGYSVLERPGDIKPTGV